MRLIIIKWSQPQLNSGTVFVADNGLTLYKIFVSWSNKIRKKVIIKFKITLFVMIQMEFLVIGI